MFMNILVGVMFVIAIAAGVWGVVIEHRKKNSPTDEKETDTSRKNE